MSSALAYPPESQPALELAPPAPTVTSAPRPLCVRPAPRREPPFDDEVTVAGPHGAGATATPLPYPRPVPPPPTPIGGSPGQDGLPDPAGWGRRLLIGMRETAAGKRPLQQLLPMLSPTVGRRLGADLLGVGLDHRPHWIRSAAVRSVHSAHPAAGVAEICATVQAGPRVRAVAMRLETRHGQWCCTRLQLG